MLSIKYIRENIDVIRTALKNKKTEIDLDELLTLDSRRRDLLRKAEALKAERNQASVGIAQKKKAGENAEEDILRMRQVSEEIKSLDLEIKENDDQLHAKLLYVPNPANPSAPVGVDENDNRYIREWGTKIEKQGLQDHLEIGERLSLFDLKRAIKMSGSGFPLYTGAGARLERAMISFMLDLHTDTHGYTELFPPFITNGEATTTTGQLPKFEDDMYKIPGDDLYCISTAEIPVTNIHRDEILAESSLPRKYAAYSACFRREAGSYGKDTRGLLRVHQFNKVEMVKFTTPETSYAELESLTSNAETVLQMLGLHYRVIELCTGDLSFAAAKCYDLEVWAPGMQRYLEVSSCSNFEDFQARRGNIRYRSREDNSVNFVHTLNGSGVATPRLMIALLETYQNDDGSVTVPDVLRPYVKLDRLTP